MLLLTLCGPHGASGHEPPTGGESWEEGSVGEEEPAEVLSPTLTRSIAPAPWSAGEHVVVPERAGMPAPSRRDDLLERAPGLLVGQHGTEGKSPSFIYRGFDAEHGHSLEVRWGIVPLNESSNPHGHGYVDAGFLVPESLLDLRVSDGSGGLRQGPFALGGSLVFEPGVALDDRGLLLRAEAGWPARTRLVARHAPVDARAAPALTAEATLDDGFGENRRLARGAVVHSRRLARTGLADWTLHAALHGAAFDLPGQVPAQAVRDGLVARDATLSPEDHGRSSMGAAQVIRRGESGPDLLGFWWRGRSLLLRENYTGLYASPTGDSLLQRHDSVAAGVLVDHRLPLVPTLDLRLGAESHAELLESSAVDPTGAREADRDVAAVLWPSAGWAGLVWHPAGVVTVEGGARLETLGAVVEDRREGGEGAVQATAALNPRLRLQWSPVRAVDFGATWGSGVRPPEAQGMVPSPEDVTAGGVAYTSGWTGTAEMGLHPGRHLHLRLGGFLTRMDHELIFDHVSRSSVETAATERLGAHLHLHGHVLTHGLVEVDGHVVDARTRGTRERLAGIPSWSGAVGAGWAPPTGFRAGSRARAVGRRDLPFGASLGAYALVDARVGWQWPELSLDVQGNNVLDTRWDSDGGVYPSRWSPDDPVDPVPRLHTAPGAPRTVMVVLTWTPGGGAEMEVEP